MDRLLLDENVFGLQNKSIISFGLKILFSYSLVKIFNILCFKKKTDS